VITVEEAKGTETTVDVVEGMQFDAVISLLISLPTAKKWKLNWRILTS
jgi:chaperonin GroEL (HSP60 family)